MTPTPPPPPPPPPPLPIPPRSQTQQDGAAAAPAAATATPHASLPRLRTASFSSALGSILSSVSSLVGGAGGSGRSSKDNLSSAADAHGGGGSGSRFGSLAALSASPPPREVEEPSAFAVPPSDSLGYGLHVDPEIAAARARELAHVDEDQVALEGRYESTRPVLTEAMAKQLHPSLPVLQRLSTKWKLCYSLDQHGVSLTTLYDKLRSAVQNKTVQPRGFVLAVLDSEGSVFGAYLSDPLRSSQTFFGTGETFVWKWAPAGDGSGAGRVERWEWTGANEYFLFGEGHYFAVGAGDGKFAIWLDSDLEKGKSHPTPTFGNPSLASGESFLCYDLEVWGIAP